MLQSLKSRGSLQMLKSAWASLYPSIKNIINEAGFGTFFEALSNLAKFCGYVHGYIYGYWQILWVLWKILLGM